MYGLHIRQLIIYQLKILKINLKKLPIVCGKILVLPRGMIYRAC